MNTLLDSITRMFANKLEILCFCKFSVYLSYMEYYSRKQTENIIRKYSASTIHVVLLNFVICDYFIALTNSIIIIRVINKMEFNAKYFPTNIQYTSKNTVLLSYCNFVSENK